jgi:quinol monooxygenase YgiN
VRTVIVDIRVKKDKIPEFTKATLENLGQSREEPGIFRFELFQDEDDPAHFVLVEGYRDAEAQTFHKDTSHYSKWKNLVEPMMAKPRTRSAYAELGGDSNS